MSATDLAGVIEELRRAESVVVTTHVSPDGDAIGSMLAMACLVKELGKKAVVCACDDPVPLIYQWLPGAGSVRTPEELTGTFDLAVVVDVAQRARIGRMADRIGPTTRVLVVDHHIEESPYGDAFFVDPSYCAVGELITDLYRVANVPVSREAAECAYVALATDTGGFRFSSTTARAHRLAAVLLDAGIAVGEISSRIFDAMSLAKFQLLKHVLQRVQFACEGRVAYSEVTTREMQALSAGGEDLDGLINIARNINGVEVAMLFKEVGPATTKVSLRSRQSFNSARFLQRFGGGGHTGAAGATIALSLNDTRTRLLAEVETMLGGQA